MTDAFQNSQSQVILWLLEELDIEYNVNFFERITSGTQKNRAPPSLKETHPLGKSPQLITPEGRVIIERSAIAKYLINKYDTTGKFKINPTDSENDAIKEEELLSFGGNSLAPMIMIQMVFKYLTAGSPFFVRPLLGGIASMVNKAFLGKEIDSMMQWLEDGMKGKTYFMNTENPTLIDFMYMWYIDFALVISISDFSKYPNIKSWHDKCKDRDAWKRSLEKGNGYNMNIEM